jgi:histidyl-tRNA synthetase
LGRLAIPFLLNPYLVRGLDYYTRTVFEIQAEGEGGVLGGGGRYDDLIGKLGGKPTPGVGFACGMERIVLHIQKRREIPSPCLQVYIAYIGEEKAEAIKLASELRREGISAVASLGEKSLKSQLRQADSLGVKFAIIMGEEIKKDKVILRNMKKGEQEEVEVSELAKIINFDVQDLQNIL